MRFLVPCSIVLALSLHANALDFVVSSSSTSTTEKQAPPDAIQKSDDYQISISYSSKGTRSESVHGTITWKGREILGKARGDTIQTPSGVYVWYGDSMGGRSLGHSDWLPKDLSTVYPSWQVSEHHTSQKMTTPLPVARLGSHLHHEPGHHLHRILLHLH